MKKMSQELLPNFDGQTNNIEPRTSGKLTKQLLLATPAGRYLASNVGVPPIFAELITDALADRFTQWAEIVRVGANGRLCYVYTSKAECDRVRSESLASIERGGKHRLL